MDKGNMRPKDRDKTDDTYPVVREDDTCSHWECAASDSLAPMRECWYCKHSDFRKNISEHRTHSVCRFPLNRSHGKEMDK